LTVEKSRDAFNAKPFRPFVIQLADGSAIPVMSPEFIVAAPSGRTLEVFQQADAMSIIDLLLVTHLEFKPTGNGAGKRRRG
jgi:hypothetical protein